MLNRRSERWDRHFLHLCIESSRKMSKDPSTQVGSIIVGPDYEVRSSGFNGFPRGIADDHRLYDREAKLKIVVHGEMNAVLAAARVGVPLKGCTLFLACTDETQKVWGGPPCTRCTVEIIQTGIDEIVSYPQKPGSKWHDDLEHARRLLEEAQILYREVRP